VRRKSLVVFVHVIIWFLGLLVVQLYDFLSISYFDYRVFTYFSLITGSLINALIFYGNSQYLLPKVLSNSIKLRNYVLLIILSVLFFSLFEGFVDFLFNKHSNPFWDNVSVELSMEYFDFTTFVNFLFLVFSFGYGFTLQWYSNETLKRKLIQDNIQTQLNMLKTQVNPHFLFNTLNNIFGLANKSKDPIVADSISKLAEIMRYQTYESKNGKIVLSKEVEYLKNYIDLQKLRFAKGDKIRIDFRVNGDTESAFIEQLILLPLVENAFKHGISLQKESEILINLEIEKNKLKFQVKNTINPVKAISIKSDSGIGLNNLKKRLDLLYPEKYNLVRKEDLNWYEVLLTLHYGE
jgi:sensor histidine kinase YesM